MKQGFYADNAQRYFPFVANDAASDFPRTAILDCGILLNVEYDETEDFVYLASVQLLGDLIRFTFASTAAALAGQLLSFVRSVSATRYTSVDASSDSSSSSSDVSESSSEEEDCSQPGWSGYLVTGDLSYLAEFLAEGDFEGSADEDAALRLEPALVRSIWEQQVTAVNLGNEERTASSGQCGSSDTSES